MARDFLKGYGPVVVGRISDMEKRSVFGLKEARGIQTARVALAAAGALVALAASGASRAADVADLAAPARLADLAQGAGEAGLTFSEAQARMRGGSALLKASESEAVAREMEAEADKSLSGPKVDFNAKMIWGTKTLDYGTLNVGSTVMGAAAKSPALGSLLQRLPASAQAELAGMKLPLHYKTDIDGPRVSLDARWVLYSGGRIEAKQAAGGAAAREARANLRRDADSLDRELALKYFGVKLAQSVLRLRKEALADQEREVRRARAFEKAGTISRLERMNVEVNRDKAKRELLASQSDLRVAQAELSRLVKEDGTALATPLFVLKDSVGDLKRWQDEALAASPALAAYGAKTEQAASLVKAAKGAYLPAVYAFGEKNLIKHYLTIPEPDWMAGVGLSFTLWSDRDRSAQLSSARATEARAKAGLEEARSQVLSGVEVAWLRTTQMQDLYALTKSTVALAEENLRMRKAAFASGLATSNEVWDARTKLTGALVEQKVAAYKFVLAWAALNSAAGTMEKFNESAASGARIVEE